MAALHINKDNFETEILKEGKPVIVDFWASWCGPCKMLSPIVEELSEELTEVKICKINVDKESTLAEKFNIMTIPTLLVFKDGQVVNKSVGVVSKDEILNLIAV